MNNKSLVIVTSILKTAFLVYFISAIVWGSFIFFGSDGTTDHEALGFLLFLIVPGGTFITLVILLVYGYFEKQIFKWPYVIGITFVSLIGSIVVSALGQVDGYNQIMVYIIVSTIITGIATYLSGRRISK